MTQRAGTPRQISNRPAHPPLSNLLRAMHITPMPPSQNIVNQRPAGPRRHGGAASPVTTHKRAVAEREFGSAQCAG